MGKVPQKRNQVLTVQQTSAALGLPEQGVRDLIEEGKLLALDVGGGTRKFWRIPATEIQRFKAERRNR
jgi:excisionase family DNA binding protein